MSENPFDKLADILRESGAHVLAERAPAGPSREAALQIDAFQRGYEKAIADAASVAERDVPLPIELWRDSTRKALVQAFALKVVERIRALKPEQP